MGAIEVKVPDIGDFKDVPIIEVHVIPGATVNAEDPIITVESDKATMEIPAPQAGTVQEVKVKVGDCVSEGSLILLLETDERRAAVPERGQQAPRATGCNPRFGPGATHRGGCPPRLHRSWPR